MLQSLSYLRELNLLSLLIRFLLAAVCGGVIGLSRGRQQHAAGLRTHLLVCIGAASVMIVNEYLFQFYGSAGDPARMGAQVISGIGFLGAGTIIITGRNQVKGLTTAAGLWASGCMGLAAGAGYFEAAVLMCVLMYFVLVVLNRWDERHLKNASVTIYLEYAHDLRFGEILRLLHSKGWHIENIEQMPGVPNEFIALKLTLLGPGRRETRMQSLDAVHALDGVLYLEEL